MKFKLVCPLSNEPDNINSHSQNVLCSLTYSFKYFVDICFMQALFLMPTIQLSQQDKSLHTQNKQNSDTETSPPDGDSILGEAIRNIYK